MRWLLFAAIAAIVCAACTVDAQPTIDVKCVEIDYPFEHLMYCDGGIVDPSPSDSGKDHG